MLRFGIVLVGWYLTALSICSSLTLRGRRRSERLIATDQWNSSRKKNDRRGTTTGSVSTSGLKQSGFDPKLRWQDKRTIALTSPSRKGDKKLSFEVPHKRTAVVAGSDATSSEAPYFVALMGRVGGTYIVRGCSGTLISSHHVLTAAHCLHNRDSLLDAGAEGVLVHAYRPFDNDGLNGGVEAHFSLSASYAIMPSFQLHNLINDVAIITLEEPIPWNDLLEKYPPLKLAGAVVPDNTLVTLYGLGRTAARNYEQEDVVQRADLEFISGPSCIKFYGRYIEPNSMICAGYQKGGSGSCHGDSGGPLVVEDSDGDIVQLGIVSWGEGCGQVWSPGVFASVPDALSWIQAQTCPNLSAEEQDNLSLCSNGGATPTVTTPPSSSPSQSPTKSTSPSLLPTTSQQPSSLATAATGKCVQRGHTCQVDGPPCCDGSPVYCRPLYNTGGTLRFRACLEG